MENLLAARCQMGMSLQFHIVFAAIGIALPLLMVIAEALWLKTNDDVYLTLAKQWAKGTAVLFAIGAVSGTVLSFELGLLWPRFMHFAGAIIGLPFALEGFAFFTEAIFIGIYFYGWQRVPRKAHWFSGLMVAISGTASAIFVIAANAWMNTPRGFRLVNGWPTNIDPIAAMLNPAALPEALHMVLSVFAAVGMLVAGVHAFCLLKDKNNKFHRKALAIALSVGGVSALIVPLSGDLLARTVATNQPVKLAAFEGLFKTQTYAPFVIGGIPDVATETNRFAIEIPGLLSFLINHDFASKVPGLNSVPRTLWPNVALVHICFQLMVACGMCMIAVSLWGGWLAYRRRKIPDQDLFLKALAIISPLGFIAIQCGWCVTEVGRQPWIIYGVMKTEHAVTPMPGLWITFSLFSLLYLLLFAVVVLFMARQVKDSPQISKE